MTAESYILDHLPELRLSLLYSNFEDKRLLNPEGYSANIQTWLQFLLQYIGDDQSPDLKFSIDGSSLPGLLTLPKYGKPQLLNLVIDAGVDSHTLEPWLLMKTKPSALSKVWEAIWGRHYSSKDGDGIKHERYIAYDHLRNCASTYWTKLERSPGEILPDLSTIDGILRRLSKEKHLFPIDVKILCTWWNLEGKCTLEGDFVRLGQDKPILDPEKAIINMKNTYENTVDRNRRLEEEVDVLQLKVSKLVAEKADDKRVKHFLRLKKTINDLLHHGLNVAANMRELLLKLDESRLNVANVDVMKDASLAMKELNAQLDIDAVNGLADTIEEEMAKIDDTSAKLGEVLLDDDKQIEIDEEFDQMMKEEELKRKLKQEVSGGKVADEGEPEEVKEEEIKPSKQESDELEARLAALKISPTDEPKLKAANKKEKQPLHS